MEQLSVAEVAEEGESAEVLPVHRFILIPVGRRILINDVCRIQVRGPEGTSNLENTTHPLRPHSLRALGD